MRKKAFFYPFPLTAFAVCGIIVAVWIQNQAKKGTPHGVTVFLCMLHDRLARLRRALEILLTVLILAVGVSFAVSCVAIYRSGDSPFTRESVSLAFSRMAWPVWLCVAVAVAAGVLSWLLPRGEEKTRPVRDRATMLARLIAPYDMTASPDTEKLLAGEAKWRSRLGGLALAVSGTLGIFAVIFCALPSSFDGADKTADIRAAAVAVLLCTAVSMAAAVAAGILRARSYDRAIDAVKAAVAAKTLTRRAETVEQKNASHDKEKIILWSVRGVMLVAAVVCLVLGICNGGMADVLGKAIRICTECIGLG